MIRLVGRNTVEEAVLARAQVKLALTARVLRSTDAFYCQQARGEADVASEDVSQIGRCVCGEICHADCLES